MGTASCRPRQAPGSLLPRAPAAARKGARSGSAPTPLPARRRTRGTSPLSAQPGQRRNPRKRRRPGNVSSMRRPTRSGGWTFPAITRPLSRARQKEIDIASEKRRQRPGLWARV
ncbi:hypothetical protein AvCA_24400 [Azotobacter vinelandii CA]|uniref:Uncharacterized protein n=2 Tax=Azotobacter vinelandii TaxID=354 RepID=C1DHN2_AZOVD|nr:hypothetical protein Avin_24400 [Azotobacter vinelandii DJ]AGK16686.1 hypothetical protein AvCA_24400 [Azotobacter vinelandii CA]AGK20609.1 hypothetical protein AvCA6_24400 [Azotobacter vinelandii CA6]